MAGKKNQFDPSEMYKQWLQNVGQAQNFMNNMNSQQPNMQNPFSNFQNMMPNFLTWGAFKTNVGSNGRISIPEAERDALTVAEGDLVQIIGVPLKNITNNDYVIIGNNYQLLPIGIYSETIHG